MAKDLKNSFLDAKTIELLQYRIQQEELSSRIYEQMALWLNDRGYINASKHWLQDSADELTHAGWAKDFLLSFGVQPELRKLDAPDNDFEGFPEIIELSYQHEIDVTNQCQALAKHANQTNNYLLLTLALKYVAEQVEELDKLQTLLDKLETFGTDPIALKLLENDLS